MTILNILSLTTAVFVLALLPGIGVFTTISRAIASGFNSALYVILGIVLGDILFLLVAIYGLNLIVKSYGEFFVFVKYLGSLYLIYLGYKIYISKAEIESIDLKKSVSKKSSFVSGLLITLSNPKVVVFYLSFLPAFIDLNNFKLVDVVIVVFIVFTTLSFVLLGYAYIASKTKDIFKSSAKLELLNKVSALIMVFMGLFLILR